MKKRKSIREYCIIDFDSVLLENFKEFDNSTIRKQYSNNEIVSSIHNFLWKINSQDVITNTHFIFKFRQFLYSIIAFTSYTEGYFYYGAEYINEVNQKLEDIKSIVEKIKEKYNVIILTHNPLLKVFENELPIKIVKYKPLYFRKLCKNVSIKYSIGNNYMDDLRPALRNGIEAIYVGKSSLVKKITKNNRIRFFSSMSEVIKFL